MKTNINKVWIIIYIFSLFGILSCDDGWYSRKRWKGNRSSKSIKESKIREVLIKELNFISNNDDIDDSRMSFFLERSFKWGNFSSNETRVGEVNNCQIIGQYQSKQINSNKFFGDTLITINDYYSINNNIPVRCDFKDTLYFNLIVNKSMYKIDTIAKIKVWNTIEPR